ncbi:MAG: ATP-binding protein [Fibromonadaceae bacterium]|jgi:hypothetical protein|nr:ATP-binding protein [Fibromonadaceae bacterium]
MLQKYFNIAGPCHPSEHYMLDPFRNIGKELADLIDRGHYFVIHAARQSGKTTLLWELTDKINTEGNYHALYCSLEALQAFPDPEKGIKKVIKEIKSNIKKQGLPEGFAKDAEYDSITTVLNDSLTDYCRSLDKPLVIFFDEADCLSNGTLITFLRQLRSGFVSKARVPFVHSIALVGMRNIRDYKAKIREDSDTLGDASPFNIVTKTFNLENFTKEETIKLYNQHTKEIGQVFESQAVDYIFEQTQGQPWLVNAAVREAIEEILKKDYSKPITAEIAKQAIHDIVLARGTHFDSLMERLKEPRVRKVIEPLILGDNMAVDRISDDYLYVKDLGLIKEVSGGMVEPSNKIYAEVIVRYLSDTLQKNFMTERPNDNLPKYIKLGKIDINFLLKEFQAFWRENSEIWIERYKKNFYQYDEAAPHLTIQAFLQRILNGGGHISREMALGKNRCDICIEWEGQKYPIELKLKDSRTIGSVNEQILKYMASTGSDEGWVVIFDRSTDKSWDEKIYMREEIVNGKKITVVGC